MKNASIIVIVKNDPGIKSTLEELKSHKSNVKSEIIAVVREDGNLPFKIDTTGVKLIKYSNAGKRITIPEQRNLGIKTAKYNQIVFIDASCVPLEGWLDRLYEAHENGEEIVSGYVKSSETGVINNISGQFEKSEYLDECPTANLLITKKVFEKAGYFDENFEYGSDVDLMWRARDKGFKIRYEPQAVVTHEWGKMKEQLLRSFRYGKARVQLYLKHQHRWNYFLKKDGMLFIYPLFIIFSPIGLVFPYYFLILLVPFIKNFKNSPLTQVSLNLAFGWGIIVKAVDVFIRQLK